MQLGVNSSDDGLHLLGGEVGWQLLARLDKIEHPNAAVRGGGGGNDFDQRTGVIADDLDLRSRIGVTITFGEQLEKIDPDLEEQKEKY